MSEISSYQIGICFFREELFRALASTEFQSPEDITNTHCEILLSHPTKFVRALAGSILRFTKLLEENYAFRINYN